MLFKAIALCFLRCQICKFEGHGHGTARSGSTATSTTIRRFKVSQEVVVVRNDLLILPTTQNSTHRKRKRVTKKKDGTDHCPAACFTLSKEEIKQFIQCLLGGNKLFTIVDDKFNALKNEISKESGNRFGCK